MIDSLVLGLICTFLTMCPIWFIAVRNSYGDMDPPLPFFRTWVVELVGGAVDYLAGPEAMIDGLGKIWGGIGWILFRRYRD
jgi:hypothetical protein